MDYLLEIKCIPVLAKSRACDEDGRGDVWVLTFVGWWGEGRGSL